MKIRRIRRSWRRFQFSLLPLDWRSALRDISSAARHDRSLKQLERDTKRFLLTWGLDAINQRWTRLRLFGIHVANQRCADAQMGLLHCLCGGRVIELTRDTAVIRHSNGCVRLLRVVETEDAQNMELPPGWHPIMRLNLGAE